MASPGSTLRKLSVNGDLNHFPDFEISTMTTSDILLRHDEASVAILTLNRPDKFNALSEAMLDALTVELDRIKEDESVRVVVMMANGRAFCAGHDLKEMRAQTNRAYLETLFSKCSGVMQRIGALPQPVIAVVQGMATAAGCQLVATCDLAITSDQAKFAVSGINIGLFCSTPAVALSRSLSKKHALEMLMLGEFIDANKALEFGLVNRVVPHDDIVVRAMEMARELSEKLPSALTLGKALFYQQLNMPLSSAYETASEAITCNFLNEDTLEGIDAFLEKRAPTWKT